MISSTPSNGANDVAREGDLVLTFSAALDPTTVTKGTAELQSVAGAQSIVASTSGKDLSIRPSGKLLPATSYKLDVSTQLKGSAGEALATAIEATFTTTDGAFQPFELAEQNEGKATEPQIAVAANGDAVAVWVQQVGAVAQIWANRYVAGAWLAAQRIDAGAGVLAALPDLQLGMDAEGKAIAAWLAGSGDAWVSHFSATTGEWQAPVLVEDGDNAEVRLAVARNGRAVLVMARLTATEQTIVAARFANGEWRVLGEIAPNDLDFAGNPQVATDAVGNAIAVWTQPEGIVASRYDVQADDWDDAPTAISPVDARSTNAGIAMNASGAAFAIWSQDEGSEDDQIRASRYVDGVWDAEPTLLGQSENALLRSIAIDARGNALAAWNDNVTEPGFTRALSRRYTVGAGWGDATPISEGDQQSFVFQVVLDASGNALAVWAQFGEAATAGHMFAGRQVSTALQWTSTPLSPLPLDDDTVLARIAIGASGDGHAIWCGGADDLHADIAASPFR